MAVSLSRFGYEECWERTFSMAREHPDMALALMEQFARTINWLDAIKDLVGSAFARVATAVEHIHQEAETPAT